ncbi:hypothetical protein MAR_007948 [Mya arenaria]|uniref:Transposase n=1 Tax=Mya arenaria TaxID=6604 RepID=A0ABY7DXJ8_MYAAR|nr:hypothetical protein MAR_007948 [Mya arenaria]
MKVNYRMRVVAKKLKALDANQTYAICLLDAFHMMKSAWDDVKQSTIVSCYRRAGLVPNLQDESTMIVEDDQDDVIPLTRLAAVMGPVTMDDYINIDKNIPTSENIEDDDIIKELLDLGTADKAKRDRVLPEEGQGAVKGGTGCCQKRDRVLPEEGQSAVKGGTGCCQKRDWVLQKRGKVLPEEGQVLEDTVVVTLLRRGLIFPTINHRLVSCASPTCPQTVVQLALLKQMITIFVSFKTKNNVECDECSVGFGLFLRLPGPLRISHTIHRALIGKLVHEGVILDWNLFESGCMTLHSRVLHQGTDWLQHARMN